MGNMTLIGNLYLDWENYKYLTGSHIFELLLSAAALKTGNNYCGDLKSMPLELLQEMMMAVEHKVLK